jgi:hypothetical protein
MRRRVGIRGLSLLHTLVCHAGLRGGREQRDDAVGSRNPCSIHGAGGEGLAGSVPPGTGVDKKARRERLACSSRSEQLAAAEQASEA